MFRKSIVLVACVFLVFGFAGCSEESITPVSSLESAPSSDVEGIIGGYEFQLNLEDGIPQTTGEALLNQLPPQTLADAEEIFVQYSPLVESEEFLVIVLLANQEVQSEIWSLSLEKRAGMPLYTIRTVDGKTGEIFQGYDEKIISLSDGEITYISPIKAVKEVICAIVGAVRSICSILSVHPVGAVVCAIADAVNMVLSC